MKRSKIILDPILCAVVKKLHRLNIFCSLSFAFFFQETAPRSLSMTLTTLPEDAGSKKPEEQGQSKTDRQTDKQIDGQTDSRGI